MKLSKEERSRIKELNNLNLENLQKKFNKIEISGSETIEHFMLKSLVARELSRRGHIVMTEVRLPNGRMDVFDLTTGINYEVLTSQEEPRPDNYYDFAVNTKNLYSKTILDSELLKGIEEKLKVLL